jgi:hypothetical protein
MPKRWRRTAFARKLVWVLQNSNYQIIGNHPKGPSLSKTMNDNERRL